MNAEYSNRPMFFENVRRNLYVLLGGNRLILQKIETKGKSLAPSYIFQEL